MGILQIVEELDKQIKALSDARSILFAQLTAENVLEEKKPTEEKPAKIGLTVAKHAEKHHTMSAAGRKKVAAAQRLRWEKIRRERQTKVA